MNLLQAAIVFALNLMDKSNSGLPYDQAMVVNTVTAIVQVTSNPSEIETLIKISRWESGGYRKDVANCKVRGDHGEAFGIFQVHPRNPKESKELCGTLVEQATVALDRIRESAIMCSKQGRRDSDLLAGYTVGTCVRGNDATRLRWGSGQAILSIIEKDTNECFNSKE
jgi:hypothetical protein